MKETVFLVGVLPAHYTAHCSESRPGTACPVAASRSHEGARSASRMNQRSPRSFQSAARHSAKPRRRTFHTASLQRIAVPQRTTRRLHIICARGNAFAVLRCLVGTLYKSGWGFRDLVKRKRSAKKLHARLGNRVQRVWRAIGLNAHTHTHRRALTLCSFAILSSDAAAPCLIRALEPLNARFFFPRGRKRPGFVGKASLTPWPEMKRLSLRLSTGEGVEGP